MFTIFSLNFGLHLGLDGDLLAVPASDGVLRNQVLETLHDLCRLGLLRVFEDKKSE